MTLVRTACGLVMVVLATACATAPAPVRVDLTQLCLTDIRQLPVNVASQASLEGERKIKPRDYSQFARCVESNDGAKLAVALFKMEDLPTPVLVRVIITDSHGGVLAAAVTTLDENYSPQARIGFDRFINRGGTHVADVIVNDPKVRYILISPDSASVGKSEKQFGTQINSATIPVGLGAMFVLTTSKATVASTAYSDAGMLTVVMRPAGPQPVAAPKK